MPLPTGPNFDADQGEILDWTLDASAYSGQLTDAIAYVRVGRKAHPRDTRYVTVLIEDVEVDGNYLNVTVDTSTLAGLAHLWQVDVVTAAGDLINRWRGTILVTGSLPGTETAEGAITWR